MQNKNSKLAAVTGAAGVLGLEIAKGLTADGYRVVMIDLDQEKLNRLSREIGGDAYPLVLDVSDPSSVAVACARIRQELGSVSVLVNNAGILSNNKSAATTPEEWRRILAVNLDGAFYLSREWLPEMMRAGWGRIVNICSLAMKSGGITAGTAYTASKGGLAALTFSQAKEAAAYGVTVNGIAPAYIKTPMVTEQLTEEQRQQLLAQIPVRRFCEAGEVAHVVRFLVSPLSGFITGEIIDINGGLHLD
jgi:3-oxoacyl-[acyl-carrier protein] reductase